jgi:hypothetical protein
MKGELVAQDHRLSYFNLGLPASVYPRSIISSL